VWWGCHWLGQFFLCAVFFNPRGVIFPFFFLSYFTLVITVGLGFVMIGWGGYVWVWLMATGGWVVGEAGKVFLVS